MKVEIVKVATAIQQSNLEEKLLKSQRHLKKSVQIHKEVSELIPGFMMGCDRFDLHKLDILEKICSTLSKFVAYSNDLRISMNVCLLNDGSIDEIRFAMQVFVSSKSFPSFKRN